MDSDRLKVINNIKSNVAAGNFNNKVEINDPVLSHKEARAIADDFLAKRNTLQYKFKSLIARLIANAATSVINKNTEIVGEINKDVLLGGAIITSNHFSPIENTVIRHYARKNGVKKLNIVSQATNFAMKGSIGFLMNYADTIPILTDFRYLAKELVEVIDEKMKKNELVLIYPEQEMWFNYRKPRPHMEGGYHFAAKLGVPIISCFVEIIDEKELDTMDFYKIRFRLHILGVLYPDKSKSIRENRLELCAKDYQLKKQAYEQIYNKKLDYKFDPSDIGGWIDYSKAIK